MGEGHPAALQALGEALARSEGRREAPAQGCAVRPIAVRAEALGEGPCLATQREGHC